MQFLKSFDFGLAAYLDFCLAHQIQQPIPKLWILSFHNNKQRRLVMIGQTRDQTNRKNSDSYFWNWLLDLVANILKNIWKKNLTYLKHQNLPGIHATLWNVDFELAARPD